MRSMTGYGKGVCSENGRTVTIEIKTVNHKFFDWGVKMPKTFLFLEDKLKKRTASAVSRGHVDMMITFEECASKAGIFTVDTELAKSYIEAVEQLRAATGLKDEITLKMLLKSGEIISRVTTVDETGLEELALKALDEALAGLTAMREREGISQIKDITAKLEAMQACVDVVKLYAPAVVQDYRTKLTNRINEAVNAVPVDESRLATEIAVYADRCAIDEEIARLETHIETMRHYLTLDEPVGRKLDFLVQEMNREANTIGSKANDLRITNEVLKLKNEIEKIREQAQNVE